MVNAVRLMKRNMLRHRDGARILLTGCGLWGSSGRVRTMMYRVIAIVGGALALAACSSSSMNDLFKPAPSMDSVQFESDPPGAEAKVSNGQTCRTPCALALPTEAPLTVTFTLNGYQPETENLEVVQNTGGAPNLRPNPVSVALTVAPPVKPIKKPPTKKRPTTAKNPTAAKPAAKKPAAKKPAATAPQSAPASTPAPAPGDAAPDSQAPSPWPNAPAPRQ